MVNATVRQTRTEQYKLVRDSYEGSGGFADNSYLTKFRRETDNNYSDRQVSASYTNMVKPVVSAQVDPVFAQPAKRGASNSDPLLEAFLLDTDNNGTSIQDLIKDDVTELTTQGQHFIVMDNFKKSEIPDTEIVAIANRKFPYVYTKSAMDVYEYNTDKFGKLIDITFYYGEMAPSKKDEQLYVYKQFTREEVNYYTQKKDGSDKVTINSLPHNLGVVPIIYDGKSDIIPFPPYYPLAKQAQKIFNTESVVNDLSTSQGFSILLLPSLNPNTEKDNAQVIGKHNALTFDASSTNAPSFISPDSALMQSSLEYYATIKDTFISSADVLGSMAQQRGSKAESGNALAFKFFGKMQAIKDKAWTANQRELAVIDLFGLFVGKKYGYYVVYSDKFTPTYDEIALRLESIGSALEMNVSEDFNKKLKYDMANLLATQNNWSQKELDDITSKFDGSPIAVNTFETVN